MRIADLMAESGVTFGTSGARGRVADMTDRVCYAYTLGFLQHLAARGLLAPAGQLAIAGDLRPSTGAIMAACARAAVDLGHRPVNLGRIPTPALAAYGIARGIPSLMVTGSHIPDDRNGIKFNLPSGEILKEDEQGIRAQVVSLPPERFAPGGAFAARVLSALPEPLAEGLEEYVARYLAFFPPGCLEGLRIGLYEHTTVARDGLHAVLTGLGAQVERLGRSETFVPVDTEAIRPEDEALARAWAAGGAYDALVSADGDGDRPLVSDERGEWLRGDIAALLCARRLGASGVAAPVSCNTAVERCGWFEQVERTRIGSPFVISGMQILLDRGLSPVVGYEANGGFLVASDIREEGRVLAALPTRDAILVTVAILASAKAQGRTVSALAADLPARFTASDRLQAFPTEVARARLAPMASGDQVRDRAAVDAVFAATFGPSAHVDRTDGVRVTFASGEIAHLRPSGNAPELRAYAEADTPGRAREMVRASLDILAGWRPPVAP
jgi:phosphomannomutase